MKKWRRSGSSETAEGVMAAKHQSENSVSMTQYNSMATKISVSAARK